MRPLKPALVSNWPARTFPDLWQVRHARTWTLCLSGPGRQRAPPHPPTTIAGAHLPQSSLPLKYVSYRFTGAVPRASICLRHPGAGGHWLAAKVRHPGHLPAHPPTPPRLVPLLRMPPSVARPSPLGTRRRQAPPLHPPPTPAAVDAAVSPAIHMSVAARDPVASGWLACAASARPRR